MSGLPPSTLVVLVVGDGPADTAALSDGATVRVIPDARELPAAIADAAPADVVLLNGALTLQPGWVERLRVAAYASDVVGLASPLTESRAPGASQGLSAGDPPEHPRIELADPACLYARRDALALIDLDADVEPPHTATLAALITSLSLAVLAVGRLCVLADDLFLAGDPAPAPPHRDGPAASLAAIDADDGSTPLRRVLRRIESRARGLSITIDGRSLNRSGGGTQRYALELALGLAHHTDVRLRIVLPPDPSPEASAALAGHPEIERISYAEVIDGVPRTDIVHRPQQVFATGDLNLLQLLGDRIVLTEQDLIGYHNPTYHASPGAWAAYRRVTRAALAVADRVVFFSEAARDDALAEDLLDIRRADVVGIALGDPFPSAPVRPAGLPAGAEEQGLLVCLGADYAHKNRPFALALLAALRARHAYAGRLVLAGGHVAHGSSAEAERRVRDRQPSLDDVVHDLGPVSDGERTWLLSHAAAVLVPSVVEGFGLLPLEAAAAGTACAWAPVSSLREVLSPAAATLVPWDPERSADALHPLLHDGDARSRHIDMIRRGAERHRWQDLAPRLVETYETALASPWHAGAIRGWQELAREDELTRIAATYDEMLASLGPNQALARADGYLTPAEQRGLLRVGARPAIARLALAPFRLLGDLDATR